MKIKTNRIKLNEKGFDHIVLGVIIMALVAIVGTFYVVYSKAAVADYAIINANGKCLNNQKGEAIPKNPVEIYTCNEKIAQKWTIRDDAIVNANGLCLASKGRVSEKYVVIQVCDKSELQGWTVNKANKTIISKPTGLCLDVEGGSSEDKALVQVSTCNGAATQQWTPKDGSDVPPVISSFTANPATIDNGKTATLSWALSGGNACTVTPGGPVKTAATTWTTGALTATTTYNLSCSQNDGPAATTSVTVTVRPVKVSTSGKFGMSAPDAKWNERLAQVGGPAEIKYRRIFLTSFDASLNKVKEALDAGMTPVISWKTGSYSWAQVGNGNADAKLRNVVAQLNAIPGKKILAIHHEPAGDGTAKDYVAMQLRALPILKTANQASVGIIANGWWWSAKSQGYTDAEIAQWIPNSLKAVCDFIAADTYQDQGRTEDGSVKAARLAEWAKRTGGVNALGIGEFNGWTAASITNVMNVVRGEPLFKWALVWNSGPTGLGTPLEGDRLAAFKAGLIAK